MRWNCPHCEELVTAGIDFENTKKAYVRCAKCNGMALVHRSAVLADYVKARRMEEEAQLEAELRLTQTATANSRMQTMEVQIRGLNERLANERMINERLSAVQIAAAGQLGAFPVGMPPLPNSAMLEAGMGASTATPPPFRPSFDAIEEGSMQSAMAPSPVSFIYTKPPAFLLKPSTMETLERSFATDDEHAASDDRIGSITNANIAINELSIDGDLEPTSSLDAAQETDSDSAKAATASLRPMIALWIAAALAIGSGAYLYREGKKALAPVAPPPAIEADVIQSKANSAVRPEVRSLVVVRVPRAILRNGPTVEASSIQTLERSSVANVVEEKDGWIKIESPAITTTDRTAWVRADLVLRMPN